MKSAISSNSGSAPQCDAANGGSSPSYWPRVRFGFLEFVVVLLLAATIWLLVTMPIGRRYAMHCAVCRETTVIRVWPWGTNRTTRTNACSEYVASQPWAAHEHLWCRGISTTSIDFLGQVHGIGDGDPHGFLPLYPDEQLRIYQAAPDPWTMIARFQEIGLLTVARDRRASDLIRDLMADYSEQIHR